MATALLNAAIDYSRDCGATALDAFPKADDAPHVGSTRRAEENYNWMGRRGSYESRGFVTIREPGKRLVMRLRLAAG